MTHSDWEIKRKWRIHSLQDNEKSSFFPPDWGITEQAKSIYEKLKEWLTPRPSEKLLTRHKYLKFSISASIDEPLEGIEELIKNLLLDNRNNEAGILTNETNKIFDLADKYDKEKTAADDQRKKGLLAQDAKTLDEYLLEKNLKKQVKDLILSLGKIATEGEKASGEKTNTTPETRQNRVEAFLWKLYEKTLKIVIDAVLEKMGYK